MYVDMVEFFYRNYLGSVWSNKELIELSEKIQKFKGSVYDVFSDHQASKVRSRNWHALDHVCDAIKKVCDHVYLHTGLFEISHKRFKGAYCLKFKGFRCVTNDVIKKYNKKTTGTRKVSKGQKHFGRSVHWKEKRRKYYSPCVTDRPSDHT